MKYSIRAKSPRESEIQYHEEILQEFEKIFNIKIRSVYDNDSNIMNYHIVENSTGEKNIIRIRGEDCYYDSKFMGKTMLEVCLEQLYNYLRNIFEIIEESESDKNIVADFSCPNCGASVEIGSKICPYCHTHFTYLGGYYNGG